MKFIDPACFAIARATRSLSPVSMTTARCRSFSTAARLVPRPRAGRRLWQWRREGRAVPDLSSISADDDGRLPLILQGGDLPRKTLRNGNLLRREITRIADRDSPTANKAARALSRNRLKAGAFPMRQPAFSGFGHDRLRQRMLGFCLDGRGVLQQVEGGPVGVAAKVYDAATDDHVGDARLPFGQRPSLIEARRPSPWPCVRDGRRP